MFDFPFHIKKKLVSNNKNAFKKMFLPHWEKNSITKKIFRTSKVFWNSSLYKNYGIFLGAPKTSFLFKNKNPWIFLEIFFSKSRYFSKTIFLKKKNKKKQKTLFCLYNLACSKGIILKNVENILLKASKKKLKKFHSKFSQK